MNDITLIPGETTVTYLPQMEAAPPRVPPLTIAEWRERELPEPDFLMGNWLTTTSRVLLTAKTGLGKSNFALALGMRVAAGDGFLHWEGKRKARRVLFVDGEMSRRLLKRRVIDEAARVGVDPNTIAILSHEDIPGFKPFNTPEGQAWILAFIQDRGFDLVIFDNIMSLTIGDMKNPEPWQQTLPLVHALTLGATGQIWIHHTGHDETRSYGDKTKEWQMDTCIHLDQEKRDDTDVSFSLSFKKAREREPATRHDFQNVNVALVNNIWEHSATETKRPTAISPQTKKALEGLVNVLAGGNVVMTSGGRRAVKSEHWKAELEYLGIIDIKAKEHSARTLFAKFRRDLVAANRIACEGDLTWLL